MNELINDIKENAWYKQAGNAKAYYIFSACKGAMKHLGGSLGFWSLTNGKYIECFLPYDHFLRLAKRNLGLQKLDSKYIDKAMKICENKSNKLNDFYEKSSGLNISQLSLKEVREKLKILDKLTYNYWCSAYLCDEYDPEGEDMLKEELAAEDVNLTEKELSIMLKSNWLNYVQEERLNLLNVAKLKRGAKFKKALEKHTKKYFYTRNSWESTLVLTEQDFIEQIDNIEDIDKEVNLLETDWSKKHLFLQKKHGISAKLMDIFGYFRQLSTLRDKRKEHTLISNHYYDVLMKRLAKISGLCFEEMNTVKVDEVLGKFDPDDIREKINQRENLMIESYVDGKTTIFSGGEGLAMYNQLQKSYGNVGNLKGRGACQGKVEGVVRVILGETHFSKFNHGEILVAPMTRPEFLPLMKKASGIITDEGGITCHAAIISRELGIPCIVGTQKSTKKLKDGMLVELDADKGVIRVLRHMKLLTVQHLVESELEKYPDLISVLKEGLLNITAAAQKFKPSIEQQLGKKVKIHAISMAIRRYDRKRLD